MSTYSESRKSLPAPHQHRDRRAYQPRVNPPSREPGEAASLGRATGDAWRVRKRVDVEATVRVSIKLAGLAFDPLHLVG